MKQTARKTLVLTIGMVAIVMLIAGCEEQQSIPKKSRLVATENQQLKEQLQQREQEIEKQKELVAKCQKEKEVLRESVNRSTSVLMEHFTVENEALKARVEELQKENDRLKAEIEQLKQ